MRKILKENKYLITQYICLIMMSLIMLGASNFIDIQSTDASTKKEDDSSFVTELLKKRTDVKFVLPNQPQPTLASVTTDDSVKIQSNPIIDSKVMLNDIEKKAKDDSEKDKFEKEKKDAKYYSIVADALNVRETPTDDGKIIGVYYEHDVVEIVSKEGDWYKTEDGYIKSGYLAISKKPDKIARASRGGSVEYRGDIDFSLDVIHQSNVTSQQLQKITKGTGLEGTEDAMVDCEMNKGINALFTIAVARLESQNGNSKIARDKNNLFGIHAFDYDPYHTAYSYGSKSECVYSFADLVKNDYVNKGLDTPSKINPIYCTSDTWGYQVTTIMKEVYRNILKR